MRLLGTSRHRLPSSLPLSPFGPFMVELFTAVGFADGPRTGHARTGRSLGSVLPTAAHVERTFPRKGPNPVGGFVVSRMRTTHLL
jgi:hypothetical protein